MRSRHMFFAVPVLLACVPLVTLLANNIADVSPRFAIRPLVATLVLAALVIAVCCAWLRDREQSLGVASLLMLLLSVGTIGAALRATLPESFAGSAAAAVQILWGTAILAACVIVVRRAQPPEGLAPILLAAALAMLILPAMTIVRHEIDLTQPYPVDGVAAQPARARSEPLPDVYYIVLDGYGRQDVLAETHQTDNRGFLESLTQLGFYVADQSLANYAQTNLSLASSLNMIYLDEVAARLGEGNRDPGPVNRLIRHNLVRETLEELGYQVFAFETGYRKTEWEDAEHFLVPPSTEASAFEALYMDVLGLTPLTRRLVSSGLMAEMPGYAAHRSRIRFAFEQAAALRASPGPKFVFLHVILPHPPFVFGSRGEPVRSSAPFQMKDGTEFNGTPQEYAAGYSAQVDFAGELTLKLANELIRDGVRPVVIVIQGDHGPGSRLDWEIPERSDLKERMGILNAYYAPLAEGGFYPSITPVNSFRVILNHYFGYDFPLVHDRSYLSSWRAPFRFIEYREE
jgi:hypothetical protein